MKLWLRERILLAMAVLFFFFMFFFSTCLSPRLPDPMMALRSVLGGTAAAAAKALPLAAAAAFSHGAVRHVSVVNRRKLDWEGLGFNYSRTNAHVEYTWRNGAWDAGVLVTEPMVSIHIGSAVLHYGQALFEGLKAFECADGQVGCLCVDVRQRPTMKANRRFPRSKVRVFQPFNGNAKRLQAGSRRMLMPEVGGGPTARRAVLTAGRMAAFFFRKVPTDLFNTALKRVVLENLEFVPPHKRGAMYLRPVLFGCGARIGLGPAPEYKFIVFATPVGDYYAGVKGPAKGLDALVSDQYAASRSRIPFPRHGRR